MWAQASVVRSEAFPETEETFLLDQPAQDILLRDIAVNHRAITIIIKLALVHIHVHGFMRNH